MYSAAPKLVIALWVVFIAPIAAACSYCIKDILSPEEFDRRSWEAADNVYVGLVVATELSFPESRIPRIYYSIRTDELLKGDPTTTSAIFSERTINSWNSDLQEIGCGDISIVTGDRLLIFSNQDETAYIARCSASRLVNGTGYGIDESSAATLERLRSWSNAL